jgi:predicted transcriptional regulator
LGLALQIKGGIRLKNKKEDVPEEIQQKEAKQKRKGKIAKVYELHQKGVSVKEIAEKMKLNERIVRAYIWRKQNPDKYKVLLNRYFSKKKQKQENEAIKAIVNNQKAETKTGLQKQKDKTVEKT